MKDLVDAVGERLKSPYFGYAMIAFIAINWKVLFYLFFANEPVEKRIEYLEQGATLLDLVILPLLFGCIAAVLYPWIRLLFQYISKWPVSEYNRMLLASENQSIIQKTELEQARNSLFEERENILIKEGIRDDKLATIKDDETRERIKSEIGILRAKQSSANDNLKDPNVIGKNKTELEQDKYETLISLKNIAEQNGDYDAVERYQRSILILQDDALKKLD